jgi:hypothetical protein
MLSVLVKQGGWKFPTIGILCFSRGMLKFAFGIYWVELVLVSKIYCLL